MYNNNRVYFDRGFLNNDEGMAAYQLTISRPIFSSDTKEREDFESLLTITDCYRQVALEFDVISLYDEDDNLYYDENEYDERIIKIQLLKKQLEKIESELQQFYCDHESEFKKVDKQKGS